MVVVVAVIVVVVAIAAMETIMVMADVVMADVMMIGSDNTSSADNSRSNKVIASRLGVESGNRRGL